MSPQVALNLPYHNPDVFSLSMFWFKVLTGQYMINDNDKYNSAMHDPKLLDQLRSNAFKGSAWRRIASNASVDVDRQWITNMSIWDDSSRPQPAQMLHNK